MKVRDIVSDDTKRFFSNLMLTCKNVSLYPEGHIISVNSIKQFHESLENFIRQHGDIRIEIERDRVTCQGIEVHKGPYEEGTLPFTLFRDGIRWLEFTPEITLEETREVLSIIHRYSILTKEPEGDIVTAFWEAHFDHVLYEADDFFAEQTSDEIESSPESEDILSKEEEEIEDKPVMIAGPAIESTSLGGLAIDPSYFVLTPQEQEELQAMVSREENLSTKEHLNMLVDILLQFHEQKDFNIVLAVLSEEFEASFSRHDFEAALVILDGVRKLLDSGKLNTPHAVSLIEPFYKDITSAAKCLKPLEEIWSNLNVQQMETLRLIFRHLSPGAARPLIYLLLLGQPSQLEQIVEDTMVSLVTKDASCLDSLINDSNEKILEKLVPVLSRIDADTSLKQLMKLARHSSVSVRRMAIKTIGQLRGEKTYTIFEFIDDSDAMVRRLILTQMSQSRNEISEDLLIKYLQNINSNAVQTEHLIECFKTLGKCGSVRSVPFLRKTLLRRKWLAFFKKSPRREGAALALAALKIPEAQHIIETAGRSLNPGLRSIAREADKEFFQKNKGGR